MTARILIVVTHLLGVGHLMRAAALARAFAARGHAVTLVSGGRPSPLVQPDRFDLLQLPPVHCRVGDFRTLLADDGAPMPAEALERRRALLVDAARSIAPDVVITELFPFGRRSLAGEFLAMLEALDAQVPRPMVLASIRDVLNPPSTAKHALTCHARLDAFYDGVLVHGDLATTPLSLSWPAEPDLGRFLMGTGYVGGGAAIPTGEPTETVLVSGGGSEAGLPLYSAAIEAARGDARPWHILVGHGVSEDAFAALLAEAAGVARLERARPDFRSLLAGAACSVSQAGYNTVVDLMDTGVPAVLVPFAEGGEQEQSLRAEGLARSDRVEVVPSGALDGPALRAAVEAAIRRGRHRVPERPDGAVVSVTLVEERLARRDAARAARARFVAALDQAAVSGRPIRFWWRDDDAVAATPALDRLLALADDTRAPLALAVIPQRIEASLTDRLRDIVGVTVLPHGWSHGNRAPAGRKKQELGFADPAAIAAELRRGWEAVQAGFGTAALPVLVPPWNRIDPAVSALLPGLGFAGLSVYGAAAKVAGPQGLAILNTHWDPIDWHGGGALREPVALWEGLGALVAERVAAGSTAEPIGLLTHHLVQDGATWRLLGEVLTLLRDHPGAILCPCSALMTQP